MVEPQTEPGEEAAAAPEQGLLAALGGLLGTVVESLSARAELAFIDLQEAVESLLGLLVWSGIAVIAAAMTLFTGALALLFIFWDTHRVLVAVLMVAAFALIGCFAALAVRARLRTQRSLFTTTLTELARDRGRLGEHS